MIKDQSIHAFLDELASSAATPGGGSAAGLMGAMGAALAGMVANLTIGKPRHAAVEGEMRRCLRQAERLRAQLTDGIQADMRAFDQLMAAYALPKATDEQRQARAVRIQAALREATDTPLACAGRCAQLIALCTPLAERGNAHVISDAGVAVLAAHAALRSAALNVRINLGAIRDAAFVEDRGGRLEAILADGDKDAEAVQALVRARL